MRLLTVVFALFAKVAMAQASTVYGYVLDAESGESLISATIYCEALRRGTTTNEFGHFSLSLPQGEHQLRISYTGYEAQPLTVACEADTLVTIRLRPSNVLQEMVVEHDRSDIGATRMSAANISMAQIAGQPSLLGEPDVLKAIQLQPGVQGGVAGTSGLLVRGGAADQNLYLLDGMPLYNVAHAYGFLSVFQAEAVKNVEFYSGSFPARYGGRLSSVVDVRTRDGDMTRYHGTFSVGLLTSHLHFEGPIVRHRSSFIVTARRSYLDWLMRPFMPDDERGGYNMSDLSVKLNHRFTDRTRLFLTLYRGADCQRFESTDDSKDEAQRTLIEDEHRTKWGNTLAMLRLNTALRPWLFNNTTLAYTSYRSEVVSRSLDEVHDLVSRETIRKESHNRNRSSIGDLTLRTDFDMNLPQHHRIRYGAEFTHHRYDPEGKTLRRIMATPDLQLDTLTHLASRECRASEWATYVEDDVRFSDRFRANVGVHASLFSVEGRHYGSLEPRVALAWTLTDGWQLKGSYTRMSQIVHQLTSGYLSLPTDLWVPSTSRIRPMRSTQYSLGGYYTGWRDFEFSAECYYKRGRHFLEYKDGFSSELSSLGWQDRVEAGEGKGCGLELMVRKTAGRLNGSVAYTLAKSERWFPAGTINDGRHFPSLFDRRHVADVSLSFQLTPRIDLHADWHYASGPMATLPVGYGVALSPFVPESAMSYWPNSKPEMTEWQEVVERYDTRNNYRLPSSHSLNLGANFHRKTKHGERIWNVTLVNAYNHHNTDAVRVGWSTDASGRRTIILNRVTMIPVLPSFSYTYKF